MKKLYLFILMCLMAFATYAQEPDPRADEAATVVAGNARFTILTDRLVRMEWASDAMFEDRASLAVVNRRLPVPEFTVSRGDGQVMIKTDALVLKYKGTSRFDGDNLEISFKMNGKKVVWHPGMSSDGNLKGTMRTLDCMLEHTGNGVFHRWSRSREWNESLEDGVLSRDGWAIIDESNRHLLEADDSDWGEWVTTRPDGDRQDLYMFAYGHDYKSAMRDFTRIAGKIPLPPKYTFGYWWSRYWAYTDEEFLQIAHELRDREIPADVFIIDMDWHETWPELKARRRSETGSDHDEFGQRIGWTGYTWNAELIPDPEGLLAELHDIHYKTSLNLHPASGIHPRESCYREFVNDYLSRTDSYDGPEDYVYGDKPYSFAGSKKSFGRKGWSAPVPFRIDQQAWTDAYFNSVIHPLEKMGVDFWWLDYQQWKESKYTKGLSNTFWLNWCFWNDKTRQSRSKGKYAERQLIYHRWGGLGSHRYQLGFSGDTYDEWCVLKYLPYFTATASNVGYGYWGHDIGGHMQVEGHLTNPEMYTRWMQYCVFTPIFKTHSTASANLERKIWAYPEHYPYLKAAIELRYALTPYIYDAAREAYDTGLCICRPMYYSHPEKDEAYTFNEQHMFGDRIFVSVLCEPLDTLTGLTKREVWLPDGCQWYDMAHDKLLKGGSVKTFYYTIGENAWFVKAGSVIPLASEGIQDLQSEDNGMRLLVIPGKSDCSYVHYEDDGSTQAYDEEYATTLIEKKGKLLTIHPRQGNYRGAPETRRITVVFAGSDRKIELGERSVHEKLEVRL